MQGRWRIHITKDAGDDLTAIHEYIASRSPQNAGALLTQLLDAIEGLAIIPHRRIVQKTSRRLGLPVRVLPVGMYLIYFLVDDAHEEVRILNVRHSGRRRKRF